MKLPTKRCMLCHEEGEVEVNDEEWIAALTSGKHIQDAMPTTPAPIREQLMTGTHPQCWDAMFQDEEDDDAASWFVDDAGLIQDGE